jgi:hypothetical protein
MLMNLKESSRSLFKGTNLPLTSRDGGNPQKPQASLCLCWDSNWAPPHYKSDALQLEIASSVNKVLEGPDF